MERASLIALGRRHLVRARNGPHGWSHQALHDDSNTTAIWVVAMTAGRGLVGTDPAERGEAFQVLQGQVHVRHRGRSATILPGDLVVGAVGAMEVTSVADCVLVVMGSVAPNAPDVPE